MASLTPCTVCQRHVRQHESACPFCGAAREPTAGPVRERGLARDAKRATLVALGMTLASPACGGREDEGNRDNSGIIPPYGAMPPSPGGGSGGAGGAAGVGGAAGSAGEDNGDLTVPPYGAMPPDIPGGGGGAEAPDSGTSPDAGGEDAGGDEIPGEDAGL